MALADIIINDGQGTPVAHTFTYVQTSGNRIIRSDMSATPEAPLQLTMAHSDTTVSGAKAKSHLFRIDKTVLDGDGVTPYKANARFCVDVPNAIHSDALADDFAAFLRNWATSANVRAFLRGSVG